MKIIEEIGEAAMLEQLAEECTELASCSQNGKDYPQRESDTGY